MTMSAEGKIRAAQWSVGSNAVLIVLKVIVAVYTGSASVLADAVNSGADLVGSIIALISVNAAAAGPDDKHRYGHGKFENLSGAFIAVMIFLGGGYALSEAVAHLRNGIQINTSWWAIALMAVSFLINVTISILLMRVGKASGSPALMADGYHRRSDVAMSFGVLSGLFLVRVTGTEWIDGAIGIILCVIIFVVGIGIARDAVLTLSDVALPDNELAIIERVLRSDKRVLGYHKLRTRRSGADRHADVHVQIADSTSFIEAHHLTEELEDRLRHVLPNLYPIIHMEPYEQEVAHQREQRILEEEQQKKQRLAKEDEERNALPKPREHP